MHCNSMPSLVDCAACVQLAYMYQRPYHRIIIPNGTATSGGLYPVWCVHMRMPACSQPLARVLL